MSKITLTKSMYTHI